METPQDLRSTRKARGLTAKDLSSGMLRVATVIDIENGHRWASKASRLKLESILGRIDWAATYAGDRQHLIFALRQFINPEQPGSRKRIRFARRALTLIDEEISTKK